MNQNKTEIINDLLGYEGLKIIQRPDIFHFSLDSTLLADFVTICPRDKKIIDLGCGNGYIPIFLSLRTKAKLYGVELQTEISDLANRSVQLNQLENQITILNEDMKQVHLTLGTSCFDVVVCNPPYFPYQSTSLVNKNDYLTIARHEVKINLEEVCKCANVLLKDGGTFAMVHRSERLVEILELFRKYGFDPKRLRFVYPKTNAKESVALLIEAKKTKRFGGLKVLPPLYVEEMDGSYTKEILKIFNYKKESTLC